MEVKLLKGGTTRLRLGNRIFRVEGKSRSKFQHEIGVQLATQYPHDIIFEEVGVLGDGFILDFFIPSISLVVECNGRQHSEHIKHFHKTKIEFHKQKDVDQRKRDWCKLNRFRLIEIDDE